MHPRARDAALSIQCDPPAQFAASGLTKLDCARGHCNRCGVRTFPRPSAELELERGDAKILFYVYKNRRTCSMCGMCGTMAKSCPTCDAKADGVKKGKFQKRLHLVLKETDFPTFWDDFYINLLCPSNTLLSPSHLSVHPSVRSSFVKTFCFA